MTDTDPRWEARDELHRLDSVAGVVAAGSIAGCIACAALIATDKPVYGAKLLLGATCLVLLGCAALATLSLAWSPLQAIKGDKELEDVVAAKGSRTRIALIVLVFALLVCAFGTAVIEVAADNDHDQDQQSGALHSKTTAGEER